MKSCLILSRKIRVFQLHSRVLYVIGLLFAAQSLWACYDYDFIGMFWQAIADGNFCFAARIANAYINKFPDETPLPAPLCNNSQPSGGGGPVPGGGGVGRAGAVGGAGPPGGGPIPFNAWMRNFRTNSSVVVWNIAPVAGNPAGFTVAPTSGTNVLPSFTNPPTLAPFTVTIASNTPPGSVASFNIMFTELTNGLHYPTDFETFQVQATTNVAVVPLTPLVVVGDLAPTNGPLTASWRITNPTGASVTKSYSFAQVGDPSSSETLNNGTSYFMLNSFPANKALSGGSVTIPANSSVTVSDTYVPTAYCSPQMCGNYALLIDGGEATVCAPNDSSGTNKPSMPTWQLSGTAKGGSVTATINNSGSMYTVQVSTFSGDSISNIIDRLGQALLNEAHTNNAFNFQPLVTPTTMAIMVPEDAAAGYSSTDPGLTWVPYTLPSIIPPYFGSGTVQRLPNGNVQFTVGAYGNNFYLIQAATALQTSNAWTTIGSFSSTTNVFAYPFTDTNAVAYSRRFYRVVLEE
jgi:hypothetical protein